MGLYMLSYSKITFLILVGYLHYNKKFVYQKNRKNITKITYILF